MVQSFCLPAQEFYEGTVKHRRLTWYYHSGMATVKGNFRQKPIDMVMTTTQAAVLLLFNTGPQPAQKSLDYAAGTARRHTSCGPYVQAG